MTVYSWKLTILYVRVSMICMSFDL